MENVFLQQIDYERVLAQIISQRNTLVLELANNNAALTNKVQMLEKRVIGLVKELNDLRPKPDTNPEDGHDDDGEQE